MPCILVDQKHFLHIISKWPSSLSCILLDQKHSFFTQYLHLKAFNAYYVDHKWFLHKIIWLRIQSNIYFFFHFNCQLFMSRRNCIISCALIFISLLLYTATRIGLLCLKFNECVRIERINSTLFINLLNGLQRTFLISYFKVNYNK